MAFDLVIRNGTLVDGTGSAARRADVAVQDGVIAELGQVSGAADRVIDASDLVVAPGFVDHHTHYDPHRVTLLCGRPPTGEKQAIGLRFSLKVTLETISTDRRSRCV